MSSSISSQWIPRPFPISLQFLRSSGEACCNRGNHARGTEIVRPSLRSTDNVSSATVTFSALGTLSSIAEILIPSLQQFRLALCHKGQNPGDFRSGETPARLQAGRAKPELCDLVIAFNMDVSRLPPISSVKEEAIRPCS